jgi:hypothetical protein
LQGVERLLICGFRILSGFLRVDCHELGYEN